MMVHGGKEESKPLFFFLFPQYNFSNRGSLTFEPLTLVPIQTKMIDVDSLTDKEVTRGLGRGRQWGRGGELPCVLHCVLTVYVRGLGQLSPII